MTGYSRQRTVSWDEFRQEVRAYKPSDLLPLIGAESAALFDGRPLSVRRARLLPWVLASIARESLAWGNEHRFRPITHETLARLCRLHENLHEPFLRDPVHANPWDMFLRTAYEQLDWQGPVYNSLARFGAVFDRPYGVNYTVMSRQAMQDLLGADPGAYFGAALLFLVGAQRNAGWFDLAWLEQDNFGPIVDLIPVSTVRDIFSRSFGATYETTKALANTKPQP